MVENLLTMDLYNDSSTQSNEVSSCSEKPEDEMVMDLGKRILLLQSCQVPVIENIMLSGLS